MRLRRGRREHKFVSNEQIVFDVGMNKFMHKTVKLKEGGGGCWITVYNQSVVV